MNNHEISKSSKSQIPNIDFSINEFLSQDVSIDFDFKPINEGLGFHKPQERKVVSPITSSNLSQKINVPHAARVSMQPAASPAVRVGKTSRKENQGKAETLSWSMLLKQFVASSIDAVVVFFALIILARIASAMAGLLEVQFHYGNFKTYFLFYLPIYIVSWISYNTFLGPSQTIGQSLMKIKLSFEREVYVSSFIRSLVVLSSWICLGIPTLFDFQGKLSDSSCKNE
ncbi:MAG: hypothetical protein Fur0010_09520 [Bdellovibrio sp.]